MIVIIGVISSIISIIICGIVLEIRDRNQEELLLKNQADFQYEYDLYAKRLGVVKSDIQATLIELDKYGFHNSIPHYLWIEDRKLKLFPLSEYYKSRHTSSTHKPDISLVRLKSVPLNSIQYFEEVGELRKYTKISGGGISTRFDDDDVLVDREPITTTVISEDERVVELIYTNEENELSSLQFRHDAYAALQSLLPSKELRKIIALNEIQKNSNNTNRKKLQNTKQNRKNPNNTDNKKFQNTKQKLKQLNTLKEEGLITEEDFLEQKKKILDTF